MAYALEINRPRCSCGAPATVRVFNNRNAPCGEFCRRCGAAAVKRMKTIEADQAKIDEKKGK